MRDEVTAWPCALVAAVDGGMAVKRGEWSRKLGGGGEQNAALMEGIGWIMGDKKKKRQTYCVRKQNKLISLRNKVSSCLQ